MSDVESRIDELRVLVGFHFDRYHAEDDPQIPDADYDALVVELRTLEAEYPNLATDDSPALRVGVPGRSTFDEVVHRVPCGRGDKPRRPVLPGRLATHRPDCTGRLR